MTFFFKFSLTRLKFPIRSLKNIFKVIVDIKFPLQLLRSFVSVVSYSFKPTHPVSLTLTWFCQSFSKLIQYHGFKIPNFFRNICLLWIGTNLIWSMSWWSFNIQFKLLISGNINRAADKFVTKNSCYFDRRLVSLIWSILSRFLKMKYHSKSSQIHVFLYVFCILS